MVFQFILLAALAWLKSLREYIMFILYLCARIFAYVRMRLRLLRFFFLISLSLFIYICMHTYQFFARPFAILFSAQQNSKRERERSRLNKRWSIKQMYVWMKKKIAAVENEKMCDLLEISWDGHWFREIFFRSFNNQ